MTRHLHLKLVYVHGRMCVCALPSFTSIYLVNIYEAYIFSTILWTSLVAQMLENLPAMQ